MILLAIGLLFLAAGVVAFIHAGTHKPTPPPNPMNYQYRYQGGDALCRTCHKPTMYADDHGPVHPGACREAT